MTKKWVSISVLLLALVLVVGFVYKRVVATRSNQPVGGTPEAFEYILNKYFTPAGTAAAAIRANAVPAGPGLSAGPPPPPVSIRDELDDFIILLPPGLQDKMKNCPQDLTDTDRIRILQRIVQTTLTEEKVIDDLTANPLVDTPEVRQKALQTAGWFIGVWLLLQRISNKQAAQPITEVQYNPVNKTITISGSQRIDMEDLLYELQDQGKIPASAIDLSKPMPLNQFAMLTAYALRGDMETRNQTYPSYQRCGICNPACEKITNPKKIRARTRLRLPKSGTPSTSNTPPASTPSARPVTSSGAG